jgi:hypothetical protein
VLLINTQAPLIQNRRYFNTGLILLASLIVLTIRYPGSDPWIDVLLNFLGIPLYSNAESRTGLHYSGIVTLIMLVATITFMNIGLSRHRLLSFIAITILLNSAPGWLVGGYQRWFASGVYALEIDPRQVTCNYTQEEQHYSGNCQFPIWNHSNSELKVQAVLQFAAYRDHPLADTSIELPPSSLQPRAYNGYNAEFKLPVTNPSLSSSGQLGGGFIVTLSDGQHSRTWRQW